MPDFRNYAVEVPAPGATTAESTRVMGKFLRDVMKENLATHNFRLFSPDENNSNRWGDVLEVTNRVHGPERRLECAPRLDFARRTHHVEVGEHGAVFHGDNLSLTLRAMAPLQRQGDDAVASLSLGAGEVSGCVLESGTSGPPMPCSRGELERLFRDTARFWQSWLLGSTYRGRWRLGGHRKTGQSWTPRGQPGAEVIRAKRRLLVILPGTRCSNGSGPRPSMPRMYDRAGGRRMVACISAPSLRRGRLL